MKLIKILIFSLISVSLIQAHAQTKAPTPETNNQKMTRPLKNAKPIKVETRIKLSSTTAKKLKENEYSLDQNNKIKIFATTLFEGLLLSSDCFKSKSKKPTCDAYTKSLKTPPIKAEDATESPYHNNLGAIHCKLIGGTGVIVKSHQNNESDFCQFKDGSLVSSWTAYYKTTQTPQGSEK